jgi:hypothetical protein
MFTEPHFAFVDPVHGNDVLGNGSRLLPWKTLQRAVDAGKRRICLAPGDAGNLNVTVDVELYLHGCGDSQVGGITTNGQHIRLQDLGRFSFTCVHITTAGPTGAAVPAGHAVVEGVHFLDRVNTTANFGPAGAGVHANAAGSITARGCRTQRFDANGNRGNDGDESTPSGNGGAAGLITAIGCEIELGYEASPGVPGDDLGGGSGVTGGAPAPVLAGNVIAGVFVP